MTGGEPYMDLTGREFGRLRVLRRYGQNRDGATWLCVCDCGGTAVRRSRAIKNPNNTEDRCEMCSGERRAA